MPASHHCHRQVPEVGQEEQGVDVPVLVSPPELHCPLAVGQAEAPPVDAVFERLDAGTARAARNPTGPSCERATVRQAQGHTWVGR